MAYVSVKDWSVDQVTDWIKGLDNVILQYATYFLNNGVTGNQLLNLRADDLENLGVRTLGHQEIILEAVEHLRNFHYELDKENLQMLALRLSCAATSLFRELLLLGDSAKISNQTMTDVHNIISKIKPLVYWLDRSPFAGNKIYTETKQNLLQLSFEMATIALRDIFSEQPVRSIRRTCEQIAKMADYIIQELSDPMILQPAYLDLASLKKKEQELGFFIMPSNYAIHQIYDIKYGSPAHSNNKIEEGDEIVQVNYQTVVGWQSKKVMMLLQESPNDIVLTLKKRPRHQSVYGQIYMKPYRLPSRKSQNWSRWNDNLPSPRLMPIHNLPPLKLPKVQDAPPVDIEAEMSSSDSDSPIESERRLYTIKPRPILQRRNTISGSTPVSQRHYKSFEPREFFNSQSNGAVSTYNIDEESSFLRDKSVSCSVDLDKRPTTVIGLASRKASFKRDKTSKKRVNFGDNNVINEATNVQKEKNKQFLAVKTEETNLNEEKSVSVNSLSSLNNEKISFIDEGRELTDRSSMTNDWKNEIIAETIEAIKMKPMEAINENVGLNNTKIKDIIKKFDEQKLELNKTPKPKVLPRSQGKKPPDVPLKPKPQVPPRAITTKLRGKLDKSHSTPAYDLTEEENLVEKLEPLTILNPNVLPDVIPNIHETIKETSKEPFSETSFELGIPVVESVILSKSELTKSQELLNMQEKIHDDLMDDLPPKPPPRNLDVPKPAYPADSPKPQNLIELTKSNNRDAKPIFEFPEPKILETRVEHVRQPSNSSIDLTIQQTGTLMGKLVYDEKPPKFFEPKVISTPVAKNKMSFNDNDINAYKTGSEIIKSVNYETQKNTNYDLHKNYEMQKSHSDNKVSPTNSIVKAMISSKAKTTKKKNTLTSRRRKVTVNDLVPCDIQGYLYQRLRDKHNQNVTWEKRWFVLLGNYLYAYKTKEDPRAACLIFLSGFTVAVAKEVKSRTNAFKVYHTGTVFYFSADDSETLQLWIELIKTATIHNDTTKPHDNVLYSETDESDTEESKTKNNNEKGDSLKKFGSLKKFASKKNHDNTQTGSTSLDRKWFFTKSSNPVPTAQFRSYRKIDVTKSVTTGNFTSHVPLFSPPSLPQSQNISVPNLAMDHSSARMTDQRNNTNFVHASNPSLSNLNEFIANSFSKQKTSDDSRAFINMKDNVYGSKVDETSQYISHSRQSSTNSNKADDTGSSCFGKRLGSLKKSHNKDEVAQEFEGKMATYPKSTKTYDPKIYEPKMNRSLPRQHRIQENYKQLEEYGPQYISERNIAGKCNERSYEMIYCPETVNDVQFAQNRTLDDRMYQDTPKKTHKLKKQHSFGSSDKKSKSDSLKYGSKISDMSTSKIKLKSAIQYTPMSLPLSQDPKSKPKFAFELNLDEKSGKSGKLNKLFGNKSEKKEKTLFGSPKLHRAIFKKNDSKTDLNWPNTSPQTMSISESTYSLENTIVSTSSVTSSISISPQADYPGLKYPPVFEAETYSLADPQSLNHLRKPPKNN